MHIFKVRDVVSGVLLPLSQLVEKLGLVDVGSWQFRDVKLHYGRPFGFAIDEFEHMSRADPSGYQVSADEFREFLSTDFQVIDGEIEALNKDGACMLTLDCDDATQWEVMTESDELAAYLMTRGFCKEQA